jgi:hypothetical protein
LGIGVIKPSGGDQTVAIVSPKRILIQPKGFEARLYDYQLGANPQATRVALELEPALKHKLEAFLQTATKSLLDNTAGVVDSKPQ